MKNRFFFAAACLMLAACSQVELEMESDAPAGGLTGTFEKVIVEDETLTKAAFDSNFGFIWKADDRIGVLLDNKTTAIFELSSGQGTTQGSFTGSLLTGRSISDKLAYPSTCGLTSSDISYTFPSNYEYGAPVTMTGGSDPSLVLPCWAQIANNAFTMKYLTGFFLFEISKIPAGTNKFEFKVTNGKRLSGEFTASFGGGEPQFVAQDASSDAEKTITITFEPSAAETTRTFIIPVPAGEYTYEWHLRANGETTGFGIKETSVTIGRGKIIAKRVSCSTIGEQYVTFADKKFEAYCVANFDSNQDGKISLTEAKVVTRIDVSGNYSQNNGITSLQGIEHFVNLTDLSCMFNQLTSLDVSKNTALEWLYCNSNQITQLDVSNNTALKGLWFERTPISNIDVSKNTELEMLVGGDNQLTSLDVSNNPKLTNLYCYQNQITSLDVSNNPNLRLF